LPPAEFLKNGDVEAGSKPTVPVSAQSSDPEVVMPDFQPRLEDCGDGERDINEFF
jgi:hypothetical protein